MSQAPGATTADAGAVAAATAVAAIAISTCWMAWELGVGMGWLAIIVVVVVVVELAVTDSHKGEPNIKTTTNHVICWGWAQMTWRIFFFYEVIQAHPQQVMSLWLPASTTTTTSTTTILHKFFFLFFTVNFLDTIYNYYFFTYGGHKKKDQGRGKRWGQGSRCRCILSSRCIFFFFFFFFSLY